MSYRDFAKIFGVSHVAVAKWETEKTRMNPNTEVYLRLCILNFLKVTDKESRKQYLNMSPEKFAHFEEGDFSLEIDVEKIA